MGGGYVHKIFPILSAISQKRCNSKYMLRFHPRHTRKILYFYDFTLAESLQLLRLRRGLIRNQESRLRRYNIYRVVQKLIPDLSLP